MNIDWVKNFDVAITICDTKGRILYLNDKSAATFQKYGGLQLLGQSLLDCHPEPSRPKLVDLLENPRSNAYTIEKEGKKKLIYQSPWYEGNKFAGLVEISIHLGHDVPNFIRS